LTNKGGETSQFTNPKLFTRLEGIMTTTENILKEALMLKPFEKAQLIDKLISSLDKSDKEIDELWAKEAEDRIDAYDQGKIKAISLENVLQKYK
jgi:putative addiction module component (TIGR02574 family)